jgi:hypothetical protein
MPVLGAEEVIVEIGDPPAARGVTLRNFTPSCRYIDTLFQKKFGYFSMRSAGDE